MKKFTQANLLVSFMIILFFNACVMTMPASESVMFEKARDQKEETASPSFGNSRKTGSERSISPFEIPWLQPTGILLNARPTLTRELPYAKRKFDDYLQKQYNKPSISSEDVQIRNPHYLSLATSFPIHDSPELGLNLSVGFPVIGIDATARLKNNTYATINLGYLTGEFILQQKLIDNAMFGFSIGPYYRAERIGLLVIKGPDESFGISTIGSLIIPEKTFYNHFIGIRSVFYIHLSERTYIHAFAAPGYITNLKTVTANAGIAISL